MSSICKGNGYNVPNLVSSNDNHIEEVEFCKPMIELLQKEIMYFIRINNLDEHILYHQNISFNSSGKKLPAHGSID